MREAPPPPVPVTVVTGFLGAGKTTLVNAWLAERPRGEVAVIVNEVGAVGVDAELLAERARTIVEITGGCVCCTTHAELVRALRELVARAPARILVETSGAASPAGVLRAMTRAEGLAIDGIVTVVDATREQRLANNELAIEQLAYADLVVLSRADEVDREALRGARAVVERHNGLAIVVTAARGVITDGAGIAEGGATLDALLARRGEDFARPIVLSTTHQAHPSAIESLALTLESELDEERFGDWVESELARFEGRLLRIKGVLAMQGTRERVILQGVADRVEVTTGAPWDDTARSCRLVIVGYGLERETLAAGFAACAAR